MEKTKKNGILKTAACIFGGTMLMTCVLGGTLAKYTSTADNVSAKVQVAKWDVSAKAEKTETTEVVKWEVDRCADYKGTLVTDGDNDDNGIACPGTWGYAKVNLVNNGEVAADVTINAKASDASGNIHYYVGAASGPITEESVATLGSISSPITLEKDGSQDIVIAYVWDYDTDGGDGTNDSADNALAGKELDVLNGDMTITIVQSNSSNDDVARTT